MDVTTSQETTQLSWSDSGLDPNRLKPSRPDHPVPHLSSGYHPPNIEPRALHSQTLRGRKECEFIPAQQEASSGSTFPGSKGGDTQGPSFLLLLLNELGAGQGPRGKPGLGWGCELVCTRAWTCPEPTLPHHRERTQLTSKGTPLRGLPGANPMGEGILREITEL